MTFTPQKKAVILLVLFGLSLVHCFFSIDWDEEYIILVASQIADGYRMFGDIWSSHQTSAMFLAPLIIVWRAVFGSTCLIAGVRILSVVTVLLISVFLHRILCQFMEEAPAFLITVVFFLLLPRGTIVLEYGLLQMCFVTLTTAFLLQAFTIDENRSAYIFAGLFWSLAVLCYPYLVLGTPIILYGIIAFQKQRRIRSSAIFLGVCLVCAGIFIASVFSRTTISEFRLALYNIMNDPFHSKSFIDRITAGTIVDVIKKIILFLGGCTVLILPAFLLFKKEDYYKTPSFRHLICLLSPFVSYAAIMAAGNLTGIYKTGCMGVSVGFACFFLTSLFTSVRNRHRIELWLCLLAFTVYAFTYIQGNLTFKDYFNYLYLPLFLLIHQTWTVLKEYINHRKIRILTIIVFSLFCASLLYTKSFCVRINGVGYSTVFEPRTAGAKLYGGISLYSEDAVALARKQEIIAQYTDDLTTAMLIDPNVSLNLGTNGKYIFVAATDGRVEEMNLDPRWSNYMENHMFPDVIFIDREDYADYQNFFKGATGTAILDRKNISSVSETDDYYVVLLEDK